jgi:hypothetical protein
MELELKLVSRHGSEAFRGLRVEQKANNALQYESTLLLRVGPLSVLRKLVLLALRGDSKRQRYRGKRLLCGAY